jgi:uncharacterized protein DUF998
MNRATRLLPAFGVLAAVQMIVASTVDGLTRPGYDPARNWISQLSLGPGGWHGTVNLATCGLWLILAALGLHRRAGGLVLWCGLGLVALAVIRTDAGLGFPPGVPTEHTTRGLIHQLIAITLGIAGIGAVARLGPRRVAWPLAAVMTVTFVAASVLVLLDAGGVLPGNPSGLLERIALFAGLGWIGWFSGRAAWGSSARRRAGSPTGGAGRGRTPAGAKETAEAAPGR